MAMARKLVLIAVALTLCSFVVTAQSKDYFRIARLSYLEGKVSFQHTDEVEWTAASINMSLQPGDRIYTSDNGRAEIEFDDGSVLRLAEKTDIEILTMREELIQLKALIGLCTLTNRSSVQFEIDTPAAAFTASEKGSYRFDVAENGDSDGIVRKGSLEVVNNHLSRRVLSGEVLHVPAAEGSTEVLARYDQRDAWDEWNDRRNADAVASESRQYVADTVYVGVSDLDRFGYWRSVDGYGPAWFPNAVDVGWSPYWDGRWQYRPLWGWTWVSYEPWGWLPYHYGRWYFGSAGWCWLPGPSYGFHFWSPGLVRFYRGSDWVSWMPLGPGDYCDINGLYFNMRNRANLYYLNELRLAQRRGPDDLINRRNPGGFRTVRTDIFVSGSLGPRVEQARVQDPRQSGRVVTGSLDIRPTARSFAPAPDRAADRPGLKSRAVVVRSDPEFRARGENYVRITNPQIPMPRAGTNQPARDVRVLPNASTRSIPDRNAAPTRTYQVPESRQAAPSRPAAAPQQGRTTQIAPRYDSRTQSSDMPSRRMDSTPPPSSMGNSSSGVSRPSSAPVSSPSVNRSAPPSSSGGAASRPSMSAPPASSGSASRPPASAPPPPAGGGSSTPVKKQPTR